MSHPRSFSISSWTAAVLFAAASLLLTVGCSRTGSDQKSAEVLKVAAILPLTGPAATFGQDEKLGIELALASTGAGGPTVEVAYEDSQGKPDLAATVLRKHLDLVGSRAFIISTTGPTMATLPLLKQSKQEVVAFTFATLSDITVDYPFAFRIYPAVGEELKALIAYAKAKGLKRIAAYCLRNQAGEEAILKLKQEAPAIGASLVFSDTFVATEKDHRSVLVKIRDSNPDALVITGYNTHYAEIFRQMVEARYSTTVLAGVGTPLGDLEKEFPAEFMRNVIFPASRIYFDQGSPAVRDFRQKLQARGRVANYEIAFAYDTAKILLEASRAAKSTRPTDLIPAINRLMPYDGVSGRIMLNENRDAVLDLKPSRYGKGGIEAALP